MANTLNRNYCLLFAFICVCATAVFSQNNAQVNLLNAVSGRITDAETQKPVAGAKIDIVCQECGDMAKATKATVSSDKDGFYSVKKFACATSCKSFAVTAAAKNYVEDTQFSSKWGPENIVINFSLFSNAPKLSQPLLGRIKAKILKGEKVKTPVVNQKVHLKNEKNSILQTAVTDEFGDFSFNSTDGNAGYTMELAENPALKKEKVFLARLNGLVVAEFKMNPSGVFVFEFLPK